MRPERHILGNSPIGSRVTAAIASATSFIMLLMPGDSFVFARRAFARASRSKNLESWLVWRDAAEWPVPGYVEEELRGSVECGIPCFGFARALCTGCGRGFVVASRRITISGGPSPHMTKGNIGKRCGPVAGGHAPGGQPTEGCCDTQAKPRSHDTSRIAWAKLMARLGEEFPLECPNCGGHIQPVAFITEPGPIRKILTHLGEPLEPPPVSPARGPPTDWGELVQVHDDRDIFRASPDELPMIDIHTPWAVPDATSQQSGQAAELGETPRRRQKNPASGGKGGVSGAPFWDSGERGTRLISS